MKIAIEYLVPAIEIFGGTFICGILYGVIEWRKAKKKGEMF